MDELAHAAGADPLKMRLKLVTHDPSRKVLEAVGEMSDWGSPTPEGSGRGVAFTLSFGVPTAEVVEVATTPNGLKVTKAWIAADVGTALDPRNLEAQLSGGLIFGLTAAIQGEITVKDGMVEQSNFHDYDSMRMYQTPQIEVRVLENGEHIRGIGEPGTPPAPAALANAVFAATGKRIRELPLNKQVKFI
jgi:isoquinoline 1-oxidoreductase beta subunit